MKTPHVSRFPIPVDHAHAPLFIPRRVAWLILATAFLLGLAVYPIAALILAALP